MKKDNEVDIEIINLREENEFEKMIERYEKEMKRGEKRRKDDFYEENMIKDREEEEIGESVEGNMVGFVILYDMNEKVNGMREGKVDKIYVNNENRGKGIEKEIIDVMEEKEEESRWQKIVINEKSVKEEGRKIYEKIEEDEEWQRYVIRLGN